MHCWVLSFGVKGVILSQALRLLMCRRICAPPELNIRICDPITSYFVFILLY